MHPPRPLGFEDQDCNNSPWLSFIKLLAFPLEVCDPPLGKVMEEDVHCVAHICHILRILSTYAGMHATVAKHIEISIYKVNETAPHFLGVIILITICHTNHHMPHYE